MHVADDIPVGAVVSSYVSLSLWCPALQGLPIRFFVGPFFVFLPVYERKTSSTKNLLVTQQPQWS